MAVVGSGDVLLGMREKDGNGGGGKMQQRMGAKKDKRKMGKDCRWQGMCGPARVSRRSSAVSDLSQQ